MGWNPFAPKYADNTAPAREPRRTQTPTRPNPEQAEAEWQASSEELRQEIAAKTAEWSRYSIERRLKGLAACPRSNHDYCRH